MKLNPNQDSTQQLTSKQDDYFECITDCHINDQPCNDECVTTLKNEYVHPWHRHIRELDRNTPKPPNPPSKEAVERARFIDKTYIWNSGSDNIRSRDKRTTK